MTIKRPNADFRPNPDRAIYISGPITQDALDGLTPVILKLHASSRDPITLFIDSPGGDLRSTNFLQKLLRAADQDSSPPCRLITVVTATAASAAADLLASGDYAIAYPHARILCHGVRQGADVLTREEAILLAQRMATSNEGFALELARNCIRRFVFRCVVLKSEFDSIRRRENDPSLTDSRCMTIALQDRVSASLRDLLSDSFNRSVDIDIRDKYVSEKLTEHDVSTLPAAEREILLFKAILDHELQVQKNKNYPYWSLTENFGEIEDKFLLLIDKHGEHHIYMIRLLCERWGNFFLTPEEQAKFSSKGEGDRVEWLFETVQERLGPIWSFFVSLCRQLQKEDHWLTAEDAYWLGLIDELIGRDDLPNLRMVSENAPQSES